MGLMALLWTGGVVADEPRDGFRAIFNGQNLEGWKGQEEFWKVVDGVLVGETTEDRKLTKNSFLVWDNGTVDDFELQLKFRISGTDAANSGIQFRGVQRPDGQVVGYQADIDRGGEWVGALYDEAARGILAKRGQKTVVAEDGTKKTENVADAAELLKAVHRDDWNEYSILAQGNHITLKINGQVMSEVIDNDPKGLDRSGILALQLHAGPAMKIEFKDIRLKRLPLQNGWKKVVFIAGKPSHGYSQHEHNAGSLLLAKQLENAQAQGLPVVTAVYLNGWPKDVTALDNADTVVAYSDGGGGHFLNPHVEEFDELVQEKGIGLVCLHYAVETTKGEKGDYFLKWLGGYFEPHWSVNPHWVANYDKLPNHPITQGVHPFEINDEWYFHMRFVPEMAGVTPILSAVAPPETMNRKDGPHSGNPYVREAVLERKEPQHTAWAYERPDGKGRGFGFTGGHFHANWQHDDFRRLVLNAIVWTAGGDVPKDGVVTPTPTLEEMEANHDGNRPADYKFQSPIKPKADAAPKAGASTTSSVTPAVQAAAVKPVFQSPVVSIQTPGYGVDINVDVTGAKSLFLLVTDGGNGIGCDWADWETPRLTGSMNIPELKLTDLKWTSATSGYGSVRNNLNCEGKPLRSNGRELEYGIGVHSNSMIEYELPEGHKYTRFVTRGVLDEGGTSQGCGSTVQFVVFTQRPSSDTLKRLFQAGNQASHESSLALEQLDVHPELNATLFASEPMMTNPASIDIDHLGRVWVCEAVNYRAFANKDVIGDMRNDGDRILILEDTDQDGVADRSFVFYQGHDIDSAHGILVLPTMDGKGTQALVSAGDSIFFLVDDDGDLKADRKEMLFTKIGGNQHDHGIHAVHFGPDGKLYFNFGNSGHHISDKEGNPITDKAGNLVNNSRKPYQEGMVFRCNMDGSEFETLGWNFRNNWEACVDSYGTIWQSDNDDDGNQGVRINFVMEYGNYGYRQELTGASWSTPRTNWEPEIPRRHWHLNDPGVVPNLLLTGAGAPTGICLYEGTLLPKSLRGAIIHCDAGPNVCRAYVPKVDGAGYSAETVNLLSGTRNRWFRPSDVCIAPDGSLMVSDWYDPGVGGHRMQDAERGRIFRLAPPSAAKYVAPKLNLSTPAGAVQALQSPNMATRYLAWTALQKFGEEAVAPLQALLESSDPVMQARALWLLGKLPRSHADLVKTVQDGLTHANPDLRITALRLLRQKIDQITFNDIDGMIKANDNSRGVLREILIALRDIPASWYPKELPDDYRARAWTALAKQYSGKDRWYLEALGISAEGKWDEYLPVWLEAVGDDWKNVTAGRDIVWRSRATQTPQLLVKLITSPTTPTEELPRYFRALDFQKGPALQEAIQELVLTRPTSDAARSGLIRTESLSRLGGLDLASHPEYRAVVEEELKGCAGTPRYVQLVSQFNLSDLYPKVLALAQSQPESQIAVDAMQTLFNKKQEEQISKALLGDDRDVAEATYAALGTSGDRRGIPLLLKIMNEESSPLWCRQAAIKALGRSNTGAEELLKQCQGEILKGALVPALAAALTASSNAKVRGEALKLFPAPPGQNEKPLPPITELASRKGNAEKGRMVFNTNGTCNKCHQVNGLGVEIGPNLSEIGKKLARPALFEAIIYPSAAISHGFENWLVMTEDGQIYTGLLVSETASEIQIKDDKGLIRTIATSAIEERRKQDISLMPADLQRLMSLEELTDVVEYMTTLKERRR